MPLRDGMRNGQCQPQGHSAHGFPRADFGLRFMFFYE